MAGITLAQAQAQLQLALDQITAIQSGGTEFKLGDRSVKLPTLTEAQQSYVFWQGEVQRLSAGFKTRGPRISGISIG